MATDITYQNKPWLAHYQTGVPEQSPYESICLPDFLERSADRFPDKMALNFEGFAITFKELQTMVERFSASGNGG